MNDKNQEQQIASVFDECECGYTRVDGACPNCINDGFCCDCGAQSWQAVYVDDYPLVDHWLCKSCGLKV